jgi:iron(III) transport system permease protein
MLLAYIAKDLAISIQNLHPVVGMIDKSLREAARISGAGSFTILDRILFPIVSPAIAGVFLLCFLPMLSELTMSVLLYGPGAETLGTLIFQLQDYANPLAACALATVLVIFLGFGMFMVQRLTEENR